ncbi:MAG: methylmalonyl-CoA mutase family protein [Candidatus Neomarinimicrobiota bacterium]
MIEKPGEFPFTRGIHPDMYRSRLWTTRQYAGFTSAEESNRRNRYLLDQGVMGLSVAFDLPTQIGYDSDHPLAAGEVGRVGVPIATPDNMERLFHAIPLDRVSTSMTINATAAILLANYIVVAENQGVPADKLTGTIQNDILKEYIARGTYIYPPEPSMRLVTDTFEFCASHIPKWNTISISGYHIREAGSTAAQELAFTLANGIAYVEAARLRGLDANTFGARLSFFFNAHNGFLTEIAKFRAARRLWATIMKDRFEVTNPKAQVLRFHTQTGGSTLAARQIDNNVVRTTLQALSAVLGGTQSLHTNSRDEALALPSAEAARLALRTQQIIAHETGIPDYPDPFGGSHVVEELTDQIEAEARGLIAEIDRRGGAVRAIDQGWIQSEIAASAYHFQQELDCGDRILVGVNKYTGDDETAPELLKIDRAAVDRQVAHMREFKQARDNSAVAEHLHDLIAIASGTDNLLPPIIDCVRSRCTVGEIADALRGVFGEYKAT